MAEASGDIFGPVNFETGDLSEFDSTVTGNIAIVNSAGSKAHGSYGMEIVYDGINNNATYGRMDFTPVDVEWFRFYFYIDPNFTWGSAFNTMPVCQIFDGGTRKADIGFRLNGSSVPAQWFMRWEFVSTQYSTLNFSTGGWHYLELKYVRSATVGGVELWVDGVQAITSITNDSSTVFPDNIRLGDPDGLDTPGNGHYLYFDDFIGTTTRRGAYVESGGGLLVPVGISNMRLQGIL